MINSKNNSSKIEGKFGLRVLYFVAQEKSDGLNALLCAVNIITQKDVVGLRGEPPKLKETDEIMILTMSISTDIYWTSNFKKHWLG